jgi:hypothetical protein
MEIEISDEDGEAEEWYPGEPIELKKAKQATLDNKLEAIARRSDRASQRLY